MGSLRSRLRYRFALACMMASKDSCSIRRDVMLTLEQERKTVQERDKVSSFIIEKKNSVKFHLSDQNLTRGEIKSQFS